MNVLLKTTAIVLSHDICLGASYRNEWKHGKFCTCLTLNVILNTIFLLLRLADVLGLLKLIAPYICLAKQLALKTEEVWSDKTALS